MRRLICWLFGCVPHGREPWCRRCGVGIDNTWYCFFGAAWGWWYAARDAVLRVTGRRCFTCGKWFWPPRLGADCCSADCVDKTIPF